MKENILSIVIPVFNERESIIEVINKVRAVEIENIKKEIIVVDDCSTDGTKELLKKDANKLVDKVIFHDKNQGKGAALRTGFKSATGDIVIIQDADFEYNPNEYEKLIKPIIQNNADVVYGSRFLTKKNTWIIKNKIANRSLTFLSNIMTGYKLTDMETCYKAFKSDVIKQIEIKENRFGFEPEVTSKLAKMKVRLIEVPISYNPRTKSEGKKINFKDGLRALYCIVKYKF